VVYKAYHEGLKRTVALKVLIAGEDASEEAISRFHREAEAVAKLGHHPNIVPVHDIGASGRLHYFAMHFVEGVPLDRMIDRDPVPPRQAAEIARKIAEALQHAHDHGILHRDVKPANILMAMPEGGRGGAGEGATARPDDKETRRPSQTPRESTASPPLPLLPSPTRTDLLPAEPMLTDFGLAKDLESGSKLTRSGILIGTPQYMAPEQAGGRLSEIDARSDVYSLGATLYEMLTQSPPSTARERSRSSTGSSCRNPRHPAGGIPSSTATWRSSASNAWRSSPAGATRARGNWPKTWAGIFGASR
jgi:serine/threonine-protein kinase